MGGYLSLPAGADADMWTARAAAYVSALPPKPQKKAPAKPKVPSPRTSAPHRTTS
jgi:hypothetical protein